MSNLNVTDKSYCINSDYRPVEFHETYEFSEWFLNTFPEFTGKTTMRNFPHDHNLKFALKHFYAETCEDFLESIRRECQRFCYHFMPCGFFDTMEKCYTEIFQQAYKISKNEKYNISPIHMKYILNSCVIDEEYYEYDWTLIAYQIITINTSFEAISEQILFDDLYKDYIMYCDGDKRKENINKKVLCRQIKEFREFYWLNEMTEFEKPPTLTQLSKKFKVGLTTVRHDIRRIEKLLRTVLIKDKSARHWMFYNRKTTPVPEWLDKVEEYPPIRKSSENEDISD